jgi:Spy/CpxP family protein refolding chaperone
MRRLTYLLIFFMTILSKASIAQGGGGMNSKRSKQIEAIKIGYITRRLDLTPAESQNFWSVYNQYQDELNQLLHQKKQNRIANSDHPDKLVDDDFSYDSKILEVRKKYRHEFSKILSPEKVKSLYSAEREFREELIKQLKQRANHDN